MLMVANLSKAIIEFIQMVRGKNPPGVNSNKSCSAVLRRGANDREGEKAIHLTAPLQQQQLIRIHSGESRRAGRRGQTVNQAKGWEGWETRVRRLLSVEGNRYFFILG